MESVSAELMTKVQKSILVENELISISPETTEKLRLPEVQFLSHI